MHPTRVSVSVTALTSRERAHKSLRAPILQECLFVASHSNLDLGEYLPYQGIMDFQDVKVLEPAPELATLPGVKRKEPK